MSYTACYRGVVGVREGGPQVCNKVHVCETFASGRGDGYIGQRREACDKAEAADDSAAVLDVYIYIIII